MYSNTDSRQFILDEDEFFRIFPRRSADAYKGSFAQMAIEEGAKQERIDYFLGKTDDLVLLST